MWVESVPGEGAAFHFTLPVTPPLQPSGTLVVPHRENGQVNGQVQ
jgi:hypothetical protein